MYCIYCGSRQADDATFCTACGKRQSGDDTLEISISGVEEPLPAPSPPPTMTATAAPAQSRPVLVVKPQLILWVIILPRLLHSAGALFGLLIITLMRFFVSHSAHGGKFMWFFTIFQLILVIAAVVPPLFAYIMAKCTYDRTEYRIFPDRLEYEEGFFNRTRKMVYFKDVSSVSMYQGVIQGWSGLGTVYLVPRGGSETLMRLVSVFGGEERDQQQPMSGIMLQNIPNPDMICRRLQQLVQQVQQQR